jgi:hypothetical protein
MIHPSRKFWSVALTVLVMAGMFIGILAPSNTTAKVQAATRSGGTTPPYVNGPFTGQAVGPTVFNGDLRNLRQRPLTPHELPKPKGDKLEDSPFDRSGWVDPLAQTTLSQGQMPEPIANFAGLDLANFGGGWPPDTNGDVGPNYYIQTVNMSMGIYDKATGARVVGLDYDTFFQGPAGTPCDNNNAGDVVVLYDAQVDRWVITDFAWFNYPAGPFYECIAVSQSNDPVSGGWYFYAMRADTGDMVGALNDYPKLGVWSDGWYMSANMFGNTFAVRVWALDRTSAISGGPLNEIYFDCDNLTFCASLLPANIRGTLPPEGSPEYFANVMLPGSFNIWQFHADFANSVNSSFTGPVTLQVADFQMGDSVHQLNSGELLDSLGDRLMMQLQYRNFGDHEALFATHTVMSSGADGIRWYEVRDPGGDPVIFQQGTYQPDQNYRWMGSIAADMEGNIAVGYSVSSSAMFPAIRYAGRLAGETPNLLTQNEAVLIQGTGSQLNGYGRWGDYSALTVDPVDDCTFWYTTEYYITTSNNWQTRIGSFKFPSCGQPKGSIEGYVYNAETDLPVANAPVFAEGASYNFSVITDVSGHYTMQLIAGSYDMTAGPLLPGYPGTDTAAGVVVSEGNPTLQDFHLAPTPSLVHDGTDLNDSHPGGNGNGFPEPGEQGLQLSESLFNQGATTSTGITAHLTSLTAGVILDSADTTYADIPAGDSGSNSTPYTFSIDPNVPCGTDLNFQAVVTDSAHTYNTAFSLNASVPLPRQDIFNNDVESGAAGWTTGGNPNTWAITTISAHSPTHSWTDSPAGNYADNANNYLRTPAFNLSGDRHVQLSGWFKYALEAGYDYVYVEYSLNGGSSWNPTPLTSFNGFADWHEVTIDASPLDNQPNVALRFHFVSDGGVNEDGIYIDDIALSYEPFECDFALAPNAPTLVSPANGSWASSPVNFEWQPAESGAPSEGYILYIDETPVVTFTTPVTTTTLVVSPWSHGWFVKATNAGGASLPSPTWYLNVFGKLFLPFLSK